jgi:DNA-binding NarL/FixJ family response regulator
VVGERRAERGVLDKATVGIVIVDDFGPWRRFIHSVIQRQPRYRVTGEAWDGLQAVDKAKDLQPDLILMDVGLPTISGIEAARRILKASPAMKILFVSENRSWEIAEEALRAGGYGFVVKSDAESDLLPALETVLNGEQFISSSLRPHKPRDHGKP